MSDQSITVLLQRVNAGEKELLNEIYSKLYADIKTIAQFQINKLNTGHTITPTVLAHDCYLKIAKQNNINVENSSHFLNCLSISMRQLLIDVYRSKSSLKKQHFIATQDYNDITGSDDIDFKILDLDRLLNKIAKINGKYSEVLNYKIILSMTFFEISEVTGQSERNVIRLWNQAKTLLTALAKDNNNDLKNKNEY